MKKFFKRTISLVLFFVLVCCGIPAVNADAASYTETAYNGTYYGRVLAQHGLYVYYKPTYDSDRKDGGVEYNWSVQCLSYTSNGFTKIKYYYGSKNNTQTGYVHSEYLQVSKANGKNVSEKKATTEKFTKIYGYTGYVKGCDYLNVHSNFTWSGNDKKIVTSLKKGTKFMVIAKSKNWYKIQYKSGSSKKTGYVWRSYVTVVDAMKSLKVNIPSQTFSSSKKYTLKVTDPTKPYALSKKIKWSSSKSSVASVSSKGVVTAKNGGTATITAKVTCGNRTKKIKVKVKVTETFSLGE